MAGIVFASFTQDDKYFGCYSSNGKFKVWETATGILKQEFTPNLHLSSPCTCFTWMASRNPHVGKSKHETNENVEHIAVLGTASGSILLYSLATAKIQAQLCLEKGHSAKVNHLFWSKKKGSLFSCSDDKHIIEWDVGNKLVKSKWKADKERVSCILVLPDGKSLLAAHRSITWWDIKKQTVIKTFTGHASEVNTLVLALEASVAGENYFISMGQDDRYLNAWMLNAESKDKDCVASFVMEASASCVSISNSSPTSMAAVTKSGVVHIYKHQLNGKCSKPLKPKVTLVVAVDTGQDTAAAVSSIPIVAAQLGQGSNILIAYGNPTFLTFETTVPDYNKKMMCLVRKDPKTTTAVAGAAVLKVRVPETSENAEYTMGSMSGLGLKRRAHKKGESEVPMEERLDNLTLNKLEVGTKTPRGNSMAQLLMQGLQSKDKHLVHDVLMRRDPDVITNTVLQLPLQVIPPLVRELTVLVQGRTIRSIVAVAWLRCVLTTHAGQLLEMPDLNEAFSGILGMTETRLQVLVPLTRLRGRLDLLVDQLHKSAQRGKDKADADVPVLVYQDSESSDEESAAEEGDPMESESDHWNEQSSLEDGTGTEGEASVDDVDMTE